MKYCLCNRPEAIAVSIRWFMGRRSFVNTSNNFNFGNGMSSLLHYNENQLRQLLLSFISKFPFLDSKRFWVSSHLRINTPLFTKNRYKHINRWIIDWRHINAIIMTFFVFLYDKIDAIKRAALYIRWISFFLWETNKWKPNWNLVNWLNQKESKHSWILYSLSHHSLCLPLLKIFSR